jgi:sporulation protein YlmC with PRC-barrel domain
MKRFYACIGVLSLLGLAFAASILAQEKDAPTQPTTTAQPTSQNASAEAASTLQGVLLSSDTIIGASVRDQNGQNVGKIERLLFSPQTGFVSYAVISVGDFLSVGEKSIMVPWRALEIARDGNSLVIKTSKQILQQAPESTRTPDKNQKG